MVKPFVYSLNPPLYRKIGDVSAYPLAHQKMMVSHKHSFLSYSSKAIIFQCSRAVCHTMKVFCTQDISVLSQIFPPKIFCPSHSSDGQCGMSSIALPPLFKRSPHPVQLSTLYFDWQWNIPVFSSLKLVKLR